MISMINVIESQTLYAWMLEVQPISHVYPVGVTKNQIADEVWLLDDGAIAAMSNGATVLGYRLSQVLEWLIRESVERHDA